MLRKFQRLTLGWCYACFGKTTALDKTERNWRFLEESLELVQSLGGTKEDALKMVDYVFGRPPGETRQEVGGVMVTLAALCNANDIDLMTAAVDELERVCTHEMIEKIRIKHASKPHKSPLPGDFPGEQGNG